MPPDVDLASGATAREIAAEHASWEARNRALELNAFESSHELVTLRGFVADQDERVRALEAMLGSRAVSPVVPTRGRSLDVDERATACCS